MEEKAAKRREKVKTAAIVFLVMLLILTFFSNTIMNYSLPEVSAQYAVSGEISSKVRGSGTVAAAEPYSVNVDDVRKVIKVYIHAGDEVKKGQALFSLGRSDGSAINETQEALDAAEYEYQQKLISAYTSYAADHKSIANLKEDYEEALAKEKGIKKQQRKLEQAAQAVADAQEEVNTISNRIAQYERQLEAIDADGDFTAFEAALERAEDNLALAKTTLEYRDSELEASRSTYDTLLARQTKLEDEIAAEGDSYNGSKDEELNKLKRQVAGAYNGWQSAVAARNAAANVVTSCQAVFDKATKDLARAKSKYEASVKVQKKSITASVNADKDALAEAEIVLKEATAAEAKLKETFTTTPEAAKEAVKTAQRALDTAIIALQDKKGADSVTTAQNSLEIRNAAKKISKLEAKLAKLRKNSKKMKVVSKVNGVVSTVSVTAGDKATNETPLAVIEVLDRGYTVSFSVTNEQTRQVSLGAQGTVTNVFSDDIKVKLINMKNDPDNPGTSKLLTFSVKGENISAGQNLQISIGDKAASYDTVVPNNAIHEDNKGKFILTVQVKSTPLGNRYIATRMDVEVLASDDNYSAVSGATMGGEYVITTSNKPIKDGMQVRMAEGGDV